MRAAIEPPLVVIVGPTAVGKTHVAVRLAERFPIEVVNADSRQVYRGMDIGTGKPTPEERARVPHHLLDVASPDERYHAARFRREALAALGAVGARERLPVVVGGTGLYVRALLKGLRPAPPADPALRQSLEARAARDGPAALHAELARLDATAAARIHPNDRVRLVRSLEIRALGGAAWPAADRADGDWAAPAAWRLVMVGLRQRREALRRRIAERVQDMVARGMMDEVRTLIEAGYGETLPSMGTIGYRHFCAVRRGELTLEAAVRLQVRDTIRYAKRQMTWFARDPEIRWIDVDAAGGPDGAADRVGELIARQGLIGESFLARKGGSE
ncbi:MAG: tRNA (adenosine(37)-N6)-dimethylallyltransferase MiaA [Candidatus Rokubacteria bacterium]|nr:tRNA (adenosine(37)-N6)-dimethylallyltransferase MiaA [Candidatus Rokubacteria bacterium]